MLKGTRAPGARILNIFGDHQQKYFILSYLNHAENENRMNSNISLGLKFWLINIKLILS